MSTGSVCESSIGPPAVVADGLAFSYGTKRALDGISFSIRAGEIYGFLGPNGGGKTTLFRILATLLVPASGSALVFGRNIVEDASLVRRQLGVVFQSPSVDPYLRVEENLRHQGHLYGLSGADLEGRIDRSLERFRLTSRRRDLVKTLSGGLKRRVELAKSLLHDPQVLLLDEPSTGLDPGARRDLWELLDALRSDTGTTIVLTTHYMEEGERCGRVSLIDGGEIVIEGSPAELCKEIGGDVVTVAARETEAFAAALQEKFGIATTVLRGLVRFERDNGHAFIATLAETFPGEIEALTVAKPSLEDVFLRQTGRDLWEEESM